MLKIKLSTPNPDFPLIRQTPDSGGVWNNYIFYLNQDVDECDYWVIYDNLKEPETARCPIENTILFTGEPPSIHEYHNNFIQQFGTIITCHHDFDHKNVIYNQQGLPWMAGARYNIDEKRWDDKVFMNYNDFQQDALPEKNKEISIILSNKTFTEGHEKRVKFLRRLKEAFGSRIEIFGRGFKEVEDKYSCIANYKYSIVLENCSYNDYWTEKLSDTFLCGSFPIYYGCPNIHDYFPEGSIAIIDINKTDESIDIIKSVLDSARYVKSMDLIRKSKELVLDRYNLFATIVSHIDKIESKKETFNKVETVKIYPQSRNRKFVNRAIKKFKSELKKRTWLND